VSDSEPGAGGFPFIDLSKLLGGAGSGDPWVTASNLAVAIATDGGNEPNLDPITRMQITDLGRVAELHVAQAIGIELPSNTQIEPVSRGEWTKQSLDAYRPFFERFGEAMGSALQTEDLPVGDPMTAMLGQLIQGLGPMMVSASAGSMIGNLGRHALGQYDLPIPRDTNRVLIVAGAIDETAADWNIDINDLRLWMLIHELAAHAVLTIPHVRKRLDSLLIDYATAFRPDNDAIAEKFDLGFSGQPDMAQLQAMSEEFGDPEAILSMMRSRTHDLLVPQFEALVAAVLGFVAHTVDTICDGLIPSAPEIANRFRTRWIDQAPADKMMEQLLGLNISDELLARGSSFIEGIIERAGDEGLIRLWADELDLPTAAEIDAPGLWLARIGADGDSENLEGFDSVPDDISSLLDDNDPDS